MGKAIEGVVQSKSQMLDGLLFESMQWAGFFLPANRELEAEKFPKKTSDHGSKCTLPPEFVEVGVVNAPALHEAFFVNGSGFLSN